jgi:hypothetical protein
MRTRSSTSASRATRRSSCIRRARR